LDTFTKMKHYHYIFTGCGLSALMTVYEMIISGKYQDKTILLLDENPKKTNDRTWSFWDADRLFDPIISKKWNLALFANQDWRKELDLYPYQYKMIQGLDFYTYIFDLISQQNTIHFLNQKVIDFQELGHHCVVKTASESFTCNQIFNSVFNTNLVTNQKKYPLLQQHFIGWFVKTKEPVFDTNVTTFMDFSVTQNGNTRFMYVLPTASNEALVEYTLFSKEVLEAHEYEDEIKKYLEKLEVTEYQITDKEQGNIPMTCYPFWKKNTKNIVNIGSAGGWTKASTGYTFKNTVKKSKQLVAFINAKKDFRKFQKRDKFWFYDLLFIDVLYKNNALGSQVFSALFKNGNPILIFKFLDGETTFWEDLKVMLKCPTLPFAIALLKRVIK
jgi:lycopene beta-cyclase